jgi:hypothetical protein
MAAAARTGCLRKYRRGKPSIVVAIPPDSGVKRLDLPTTIRSRPIGAMGVPRHHRSSWDTSPLQQSNKQIVLEPLRCVSLIRREGGLMANARTVLSILEPIASSATATADKEMKTEARKAEEVRRLAGAKAAGNGRNATKREARVTQREAEGGAAQPSSGSHHLPETSVEPKPATIPDRSTPAAEVLRAHSNNAVRRRDVRGRNGQECSYCLDVGCRAPYNASRHIIHLPAFGHRPRTRLCTHYRPG